MNLKTSVFVKTTAIFIIAVVFSCYGQTTTFGGRYTYQLLPPAFVKNSSPSNIFSQYHTRSEKGIYALRYFKKEKWGLKIGIENGSIPFYIGIDAASDAFRDGAVIGGEPQINIIYGVDDFFYKSATASGVHRISLKNRHLEISTGISARYYGGGEGSDVIGFAFNRSGPYDPSQGPLDVNAELKSFRNDIHVSFPVSIDYVFKTSKRTQLKIGLMHNIAIKPLAENELTVIMYKKEYKGKFSPRTSFWGANAILDINLRKTLREPVTKDRQPKDVTNSYRKSIFIERHGSGVFLSANYDTRIKKDVNNGFGVKAGIGIGDLFLSTVTNDNKPTLKRSLTVPIGINYILGQKKHGLEAGVGFTPQFALDEVRDGYTGVKHKFPYHIGYRFQPKKEGLVARIAWSPVMDKLFGWNNFKYISYNTGISIGYSFK